MARPIKTVPVPERNRRGRKRPQKISADELAFDNARANEMREEWRKAREAHLRQADG